MTRTNRLLAGIQIGLGALFLVSGLPKVAGIETAVEQFEEYGFPGWAAPITGVFEVFGGAGLWLGLARPTATLVAGLLLMPTMVVGSLLHRERADDPDVLAVPPAVLAGLLGGVTLKSAWQVRKRRLNDTGTDVDGEENDASSSNETAPDDEPETSRIE